MNKDLQNKLLDMLNRILLVEDVEIKNCAIESLIEFIKDLNEEDSDST